MAQHDFQRPRLHTCQDEFLKQIEEAKHTFPEKDLNIYGAHWATRQVFVTKPWKVWLWRTPFRLNKTTWIFDSAFQVVAQILLDKYYDMKKGFHHVDLYNCKISCIIEDNEEKHKEDHRAFLTKIANVLVSHYDLVADQPKGKLHPDLFEDMFVEQYLRIMDADFHDAPIPLTQAQQEEMAAYLAGEI